VNATINGTHAMQTPQVNNLLYPLSIHDKDILAIYPYGSHVYGTNTINSDEDYIVVVKDDISIPNDTIKINEQIDMTIYNENSFIDKIKQHEISILECLFLPKGQTEYNINYSDYFVLDLSKLRSSLSAKASNSFVKAKKKIAKGDFYIGRKSLWHSFRIIMFGIQIAKHRKIIDYTVANYLYDDIVNNKDKSKYLGLHNQLMTEFRTLAPK